jgi:hypothetical protein
LKGFKPEQVPPLLAKFRAQGAMDSEFLLKNKHGNQCPSAITPTRSLTVVWQQIQTVPIQLSRKYKAAAESGNRSHLHFISAKPIMLMSVLLRCCIEDRAHRAAIHCCPTC